MRTRQKLISIIMPVYNVEAYLPKCINSILSQTYKKLEVILVDDGSTDSSGKICDSYAEKYENVFVIHQTNQGQSVARNIGASYVRGEYLLFLDSDDFLMDKTALEQINACANTCDLVSFAWKEVPDGLAENNYSTCGPMNKLKRQYLNGEKYLLAALKAQPLYPWYPWIYAYRTDFWREHKFQYIPKIKFEDIELTYKVVLAAKSVAVIDKPLYHYRTQRKGSTVTEIKAQLILDELNVIAKNIMDVLEKTIHTDLKKALCNNFSCQYYAILIHSTFIKNKNECKVIWNELEKQKWICSYTTEPRQLVVKWCIQLMGIPFTAFVLKMRRKIKYCIKNKRFDGT